MIRVVADTNVYISALNFGGTSDEVLALGRKQEILIFIPFYAGIFIKLKHS